MTSRIGLGLAAAGRPAYITTGRAAAFAGGRSVDDLRSRCEELLDAAYAAGVRYVDVARSYGRAEEFLAGWLEQHPDARVVVGSKWGYRYVGDWALDAPVHEVKDHTVKAFREQSTQSRSLLGDRLAIYHIHSLTPDSPALTDQKLHRALAKLRDSGVRVGFSTSGPAQADVVRAALAVRAGGEPLFSSVESTWNLLEPSAAEALTEAAVVGATVIVKEVVANGRLAPGSGDASPVVAEASRVAESLGASLDAVAYAAALEQPWAWQVLSGAVTPDQLAFNLQGEKLTLPTGFVESLAALAQPPEVYWSERSARPWS
ncbi:aldo/keto reductase [Spongisporangium articulatum]|uniref:Aldo/keto reductase n=1 Tax=Spongisporangium articulatum TaxID=3362603 RepID=A0ABW8AH53_9ACTN